MHVTDVEPAGTRVQCFPKRATLPQEGKPPLNVRLRRSAACYAVDFGSGRPRPTTTQARLARPSTASSA